MTDKDQFTATEMNDDELDAVTGGSPLPPSAPVPTPTDPNPTQPL